ncbi:hypothetical protein AYI68_g4375 [Smittium mucronatum]|uniref:Uncharacterized protein n=1 Tax=Smittium mucronatum TaxID=133383 RepID=A0A1R0GX98_9FUNG|nr:hypothetical protein AYI68_g4375 [Smittium mucronatum]
MFRSKSKSPKSSTPKKLSPSDISSPSGLRSLSHSPTSNTGNSIEMGELDSVESKDQVYWPTLSSVSSPNSKINTELHSIDTKIPSLSETLGQDILKSNLESVPSDSVQISDVPENKIAQNSINTPSNLENVSFKPQNSLAESSDDVSRISPAKSISAQLDLAINSSVPLPNSHVSQDLLVQNTKANSSSTNIHDPSLNSLVDSKLKDVALGSNKLDSIVNDFKKRMSIITNPTVTTGGGLENIFSQIDLSTNREFSNSAKRTFIETITPVKKELYLEKEKSGFVDSPLRAPPPFKKLFSQNQNISSISSKNKTLPSEPQLSPILTSPSFQKIESDILKPDENIADIDTPMSPTHNKTSNLNNNELIIEDSAPVVIGSSDIKEKFNANIESLSVFDPFGSSSITSSINPDQALASLIPLPSSPFPDSEEPHGFDTSVEPTIKSNKKSTDTLLVPITPSKGLSDKGVIDWESPGTFGVYNDSQIEEETLLQHSRELEAQKNMYLEMINNLKTSSDMKLQEMQEIYNQEKDSLVDGYDFKIAKLEADLSSSLEKSAGMEEEMKSLMSLNLSLEQKIDDFDSEIQNKLSEMEKRKNAESEFVISDLKKEFETHLNKTIEDMKIAHKKEISEIELKNDESLRELEAKHAKESDELLEKYTKESENLAQIKDEYQEYIQLSGAYMDGKDKENDGLTRELANLTLERQGLNDQVLNLNKALIDTQDKLSATDTQLSELERLNIELSEEKVTLEKDLKVAIDREQIIVNHFKEQSSLAMEKISELEAQLSQAQSDSDIYKAQVARLEFSLKRAKVETANLKEENEELTNMYSNLESMMSKGRG